MGVQVMSSEPKAYKLGIKPNGEPVLLGRYDWVEYNGTNTPIAAGCEWRAMQTIRLDDQGKEI